MGVEHDPIECGCEVGVFFADLLAVCRVAVDALVLQMQPSAVHHGGECLGDELEARSRLLRPLVGHPHVFQPKGRLVEAVRVVGCEVLARQRDVAPRLFRDPFLRQADPDPELTIDGFALIPFLALELRMDELLDRIELALGHEVDAPVERADDGREQADVVFLETGRNWGEGGPFGNRAPLARILKRGPLPPLDPRRVRNPAPGALPMPARILKRGVASRNRWFATNNVRLGQVGGHSRTVFHRIHRQFIFFLEGAGNWYLPQTFRPNRL